MLDTLAPNDPVLLLAIVEGSFSALPRDVRGWFGLVRSSANVFDFSPFAPTAEQRAAFFKELLEGVRRKPSEWPDAWKKRKRILDVLPVAPPLAPRELSEAELASQLVSDLRTMAQFKASLHPIMNDLKRKHKVFAKKAHVRGLFPFLWIESNFAYRRIMVSTLKHASLRILQLLRYTLIFLMGTWRWLKKAFKSSMTMLLLNTFTSNKSRRSSRHPLHRQSQKRSRHRDLRCTTWT